MSLLLFTSDRFVEHQTPPGHPERPERADAMRGVALKWAERGVPLQEPRPGTLDELRRVHDEDYLTSIAETAGKAVALDPDTFTSPESHEIALLAVGAAVGAVEAVMSGGAVAGVTRAAAFVRPPGHHAERRRAMGFCLYNNAAVAAAHALTLGASRVAVVDYDVHHGNGTQDIFYENPRVLYVSTHQYPFYPGTGAAEEVGRGDGRGFTVNVPLEVGATDADYDLVFREIVLPVLKQYGPDVVLISAGFDAHERDPLGGMRVTTAGYAALTRHLRDVAESESAGRIVAITEGGYDLKALGQCLDALVEVLDPDAPNGGSHAASTATQGMAALRQAQGTPSLSRGEALRYETIPPSAGSTARAQAALPRVRAALKPYWQL